jgi:molybdate transport system ATP-binding protein
VNNPNSDHSIRVDIRQQSPIPLSISFTCAPGEFLAIVGPSGAGKSTALRSIAGLYEPAVGKISCGSEVWFDSSKHIALPPQRRRVGLVFQSYALFPHLSALHNVASAMSHHPKTERLDRAQRLLGTVHLDGFQDRRPSELSGGQQQRIALARALARDPNVLLLDEPLSAVDRRTRRRLRAELLEVRTTLSAPVILVTHDLDDASALADRMLVLDRGEVIQEGAPRDVMTNPGSERVREALDLR